LVVSILRRLKGFTMLVITRTNLAQNFAPIVGKNGKVSADAKRVAATLNGVSAAQAMYLGLTNGKARKTLADALDSFSLAAVCGRPRLHFGELFGALNTLLGFPLTAGQVDPATGKVAGARELCAALVAIGDSRLNEARAIGDKEGYTKATMARAIALENILDVVSCAWATDTAQRDAALAGMNQPLPA
jgi:hypothetical protein